MPTIPIVEEVAVRRPCHTFQVLETHANICILQVASGFENVDSCSSAIGTYQSLNHRFAGQDCGQNPLAVIAS